MALSKEVQELYDLVTRPEFLEPRPKPVNKLAGQLSELNDHLVTGLKGILDNYEQLEQSSVLKPLEPGASSIAVGVKLAPLLTTIKGQCDELVETGPPKDNIAENIDNTLGKSKHNLQLLNQFVQETDQSISNLQNVFKLATSLFPRDTIENSCDKTLMSSDFSETI